MKQLIKLSFSARFWLLMAVSVAMVGCSSAPQKPTSSSKNSGSRYAISQDHGPAVAKDMSKVPDAVPKVEPKSRGGNKSHYRVFGKSYYVLPTADGYKETGGASWYGKKFHGHTTSNGEVYDMYSMTAAHKSLPLPTYVRVTNLANGKQVIVRVNDRGPFHPGRIIDLSYAAASRLDMLKSGVAKVEVEAIDARTWTASKQVAVAASQPSTSAVPIAAVKQAASNNTAANFGQPYVQAGAFSQRLRAEEVAEQLHIMTGTQAIVREQVAGGRVLHRVHLGPVTSQTQVDKLVAQLESAGFSGAHKVTVRDE